MNYEAVKCYSFDTHPDGRIRSYDANDPRSVGNEVHSRARAYMAEQSVDYAAALDAVLAADPELKEHYARAGR